MATLVAACMVLTACLGDDDADAAGTDDPGKHDTAALDEVASPVPTDDFISDNGYGDITLGRTLEEIAAQYGVSALAATDYADGALASFAAPALPQMQFVFKDDILVQVDVTDPGLPSINGLHQVGDPIADVLSRYRERIADGETLAVTCSTGVLMARARSAYRLVFFNDGTTVNKISSLGRDAVVPGEPCAAIDAPPVEEHAEPEPAPTRPTVDDFVPDAFGADQIAVRNPSTDMLSDGYRQIWGATAGQFKALGVVDWVDTVVSCLYAGDPPAVAAGIYLDGPWRLVVAVAPQHIATLENLECTVREMIWEFVCPFCAVMGPSANAYTVDIDGEWFVIAYATMGGRQDVEAMCGQLPYCRDTTFETIPPSEISVASG